MLVQGAVMHDRLYKFPVFININKSKKGNINIPIVIKVKK